MDIVTHGLMGAILASPLFPTHPLSAAAFAFGNVLPDLDSLSRCAGKRAFLATHQGPTHAYASALVAGLGLDLALRLGAPGWHEPLAGPALALGMGLHSTLDYTNTFGIQLFAPFSRQRRACEWVFFIDAVVLLLSALALAGIVAAGGGWLIPALYALSLTLYWALKGALRARAGRQAPPETLSLLPSALLPWTFLGVARPEGADAVTLFRLDVRDGARSHEERIPILDGDYAELLAEVAEFQAMRALSPAYHLVSAEPEGERTRLRCRDLRTRNFQTSFGELELVLDAQGQLQERVFHV